MKHSKSFLGILGFNIRIERHRKGYSQEDLAEHSGLHRTYIGVVERGEKNISIFNCLKISKALGINLYELIRCSEESFHQYNKTSDQPEEAMSNG
jgi:transcriptional regulator with XRE-family HTH domain